MGVDSRQVSFVVVGVITLIYVFFELAAALQQDSLTLMSDGFHNLSDVISLYIALWATRAAQRGKDDNMSYGWARTETLGALTNGVFLLSLSLYILLEAIPDLISPVTEGDEGLVYIVVAGIGVLINTFGTIIFCMTGHAHSHGGGGHSHGGSSEGEIVDEVTPFSDHSHAHGLVVEKDPDMFLQNSVHDDAEQEAPQTGNASLIYEEEHKGHEHAHSEKKMDMNVYAVLIHYAGDMFSSIIVLFIGIVMYFYDTAWWVVYLDPIGSLIIIVIILWTTIPLVKNCSKVLLQSTPANINISVIRNQISKVPGVLSLHDLHIWQLVDGVSIASVHVLCEDPNNFMDICDGIRKVFHRHKLHSSTIQPEFLAPELEDAEICPQNCVVECEEDWCCKPNENEKEKEKEKGKEHMRNSQYGALSQSQSRVINNDSHV